MGRRVFVIQNRFWGWRMGQWAYHVLADLVLIIHTACVAFVICGFVAIVVGGFCGWQWVRRVWFRFTHLALIVFIAGQALLGQLCPLTKLENWLRRLGGEREYPGAFIGYWLDRLLFFDTPVWVFAIIYTLFAVAVAGTLRFVPVQWGSRRPVGTSRKGLTRPRSQPK